jgi:hypothetical protein
MDTKVTLRAAQAHRDAEVRRLNSEAAKRYLAKRETAASAGMIREVLTGVVFVTTAVAVIVIALAL